MDEYEVDLRVYVRILWRGKWIVAAVFAVALGLAAVLTVRTPVQHRAEVLLALDLPAGAPRSYTVPTPQWVIERVRDPQLLAVAARGTAVSPGWLAEALGARVQAPFVLITVQSVLPAAELVAVLTGVVDALREDLAGDVGKSAEQRLLLLDSEREVLLTGRAMREEEFDRVRVATQANRDRLREEIRRIGGDAALRALSVGAAATVQGYLVQKDLDVLYVRLQAAELALDEMERLGPAYVGGEAWRNAAGQLTALSGEEEALRSLRHDPPSPVAVMRGPTSSGPLRTSLKMNLALAGVLGLFIGVLLAFFVHWLRAGPREAEEAVSNATDADRPVTR